jgi:hypothetical protein
MCSLYFLRVFNESESFYKVGITSHSVQERYPSRRHLMGYEYELLALYQSVNAVAIYEWEQSILFTFSHLSYQPKQPFGGETECFSQAEPILAALPFGTVFYEVAQV